MMHKKRNFFRISYIIPVYRCINVAHPFNIKHQQVKTYINLEVGSSRCRQAVQMQSWEGIDSVKNPYF